MNDDAMENDGRLKIQGSALCLGGSECCPDQGSALRLFRQRASSDLNKALKPRRRQQLAALWLPFKVLSKSLDEDARGKW